MSNTKRARTEEKQPVVLPDSFGEVRAILTSFMDASEPGMYSFTLEDAPVHMQEQIRRRAAAGQTDFLHIYADDGADGMNGLVAPDEEEVDDDEDEQDEADRAEEIIDYLCRKTSVKYELGTPFSGTFHLQFVILREI